MKQEDITKLKKQSKEILAKNTYVLKNNGKTHRWIVPSKQFYVHQWNWDSATHAMGLVHSDPDLAIDELRSLVRGQWENGLIAQIRFNPEEKSYFPGPELWGTEGFVQDNVITSGITQPPLLGVAVSYVYQKLQDRKKAQEFIAEILPRVLKYHEFLKKYRDPEDSGLLTIVHPWESGTDNSPRFDTALEAIKLDSIPESVKTLVHEQRIDATAGDESHRPRMHDYYRYMHLVTLFKKWNWDPQKMVAESPFANKDILFSSLWLKANEDLAEVLESLERKEEAKKLQSWAEQTREAIINTWDETAKQYSDLNVALGKKESIKEATIATFGPLYAKAYTEKQYDLLFKKLTDPQQFYPAFPVPSTALASPQFDTARYWRGPSWPVTNMFIVDGLSMRQDDLQALKLRDEILEKTLQTVVDQGFFEYYSPFGEKRKDGGLGFGEFSWTAAICLYLIERYL